MTTAVIGPPAVTIDGGGPVRYRPEPVAHHGTAAVAAGRRAVTGAWRHPSPELCDDRSPFGVWIGPRNAPEQQVLVCPSCGLDCT